MNENQLNCAEDAMIDWISGETGKSPNKIEFVKTFEMYDMTYYIFKYKKGMFGKWLVGVCGGYEGDSSDNCGHVFSEMAPFDESTAESECKSMVEKVRAYRMGVARQQTR